MLDVIIFDSIKVGSVKAYIVKEPFLAVCVFWLVEKGIL